jgi:hypothetical protein
MWEGNNSRILSRQSRRCVSCGISKVGRFEGAITVLSEGEASLKCLFNGRELS